MTSEISCSNFNQNFKEAFKINLFLRFLI